jgi:hypothetical protein
MHELAVATSTQAPTDLHVLDAMALLASETGLVVHVVLPRNLRVIPQARAAAEVAGLDIAADVLPNTVRVRFSR